MGNHDALGVGRRTRGVLQEGDILRAWRREGAGRGRLAFQVHRKPLQPFAGKPIVQILPQRECRAGEGDGRAAVRHDGGAGVARTEAARHHHGHRDHPGDLACKKGDDEFQAGWKHQDGAVTRHHDRCQPRRERPRFVLQLAEADNGFLAAAIGEENIRPIVGLGSCALFKQRHERRKRFHFAVSSGAPVK